MWEVGTQVNLKVYENSWSLYSHTLIVSGYDGKWVYCSRKGKTNDVHPYLIEEVEKLSINPFVRIKRLFCRAFEL